MRARSQIVRGKLTVPEALRWSKEDDIMLVYVIELI